MPRGGIYQVKEFGYFFKVFNTNHPYSLLSQRPSRNSNKAEDTNDGVKNFTVWALPWWSSG